jgi:hypothetical protein
MDFHSTAATRRSLWRTKRIRAAGCSGQPNHPLEQGVKSNRQRLQPTISDFYTSGDKTFISSPLRLHNGPILSAQSEP